MNGFALPDGSPVAYIGAGEDFGNHGHLLTSLGHGAHVKWASGPKRGRVTLVDTDDLVPGRHKAAVERSELDDSLEVGLPLHATGMRAVQDTEGTVGVLNLLATSGHLGDLQDVADDALATVVARLRQHDGLRAAVAQLDDEEGEELVQLTAQTLLRDAFGAEDD